MRLSRRTLLKLGLFGAAGLAMPGRFARAEGPPRSPAVTPFVTPLPVPPMLRPVRVDATTDYYEVVQRPGTLEIVPGLRTGVWGYDGAYPGPTIEARKGRRVVVRQQNELPVPVSTHLHGGIVTPEHDGYPTDLIPPGGFRDYVYPNIQRPGTLWYHDHRMDFTGPQVYRGLAGFYLVRDDAEESLPLPAGERDIPLMIADRTLNPDGSLWYPSIDSSLMGRPGVLPDYMTGVEGDIVLVNGAPWPFLEVANARYRFRLLNASNARRYELALDPAPGLAPFVQVAADGGLLEAPLYHNTIFIAPGERYDVVVDFGRFRVGSEVSLTNLRGEGPTGEVMRFVVTREVRDHSRVPARLAAPEPVQDAARAAARRQFQFFNAPFGGMATINGLPFDPDRIDASPRLGDAEIWKFEADFAHPVHLHGVHFRVLTRNDGLPEPRDRGWKDTVFIPGGTLEILVPFTHYRGKYVFHCHNLEHEDMAMMANFEVT